MKIPKHLIHRVRDLAKAGFHVTDIEPRAGSHFKVRFAELETAYFMSGNDNCPRAMKNCISDLRRMAATGKCKHH